MPSSPQVVVIGASHAAVQLIVSLRQQGWRDKIIVISDEPHMPYQRPPLSKAFLAGDIGEDQLILRAATAYEKLDVEFVLGVAVTAIDTDNHQLSLSNGSKMPFTKLALCTGARARPLPIPGADLEAVHYLRSMNDVKGIQQSATKAKSATIIGGGYIGLETAASLNKLGIAVTVLETEDRLLKRVASEPISRFYQNLHQQKGVAIKLATGAVAINGTSIVTGVACADGTSIDTDMVIIGIGVIPNTELADKAGLTVDNGIVVNQYAQTSHKDIVAAGDCTNHPNPELNTTLRLESVPNATEQAKAAAASICGLKKAYAELPWFWSDQYEVKLQIAGISQGYNNLVVRGQINEDRSFSVFYLKDSTILAADCVNRPKDFMLAKKLILHGDPVDPKDLANDSTDLKTLIEK